MCQQVVVVMNKIFHCQPKVAVAKQGQQWLGARYAHVTSNVKLFFIDQQRVINISRIGGHKLNIQLS